MTTFDAIRTGFRITRRFPRIGAIETLWRTAFAILVMLFLLLGAGFFLKNATISNLELQTLRSRIPILISLTLQRLAIRYWPDLWRLALFIGLMSCLMWLIFASIFRSGILGMLRGAMAHGPQDRVASTPASHFADDVKGFFAGMGAINLTCQFFSLLILVMGAAVFWASVKFGVATGETLGPIVAIVCLTLGWTFLFFLWAILDVVTDVAQIGLVFERRSFASAMRRAAQVVQSRLGAVIGIGLFIFVLRMVILIVFGIANTVTNFIANALWPPLMLPAAVVVWFLQSVLTYYLYIMNLASFACLFSPQPAEEPAPIPVTEKLIYEQ
jgi:hypothetical protein